MVTWRRESQEDGDTHDLLGDNSLLGKSLHGLLLLGSVDGGHFV